MIITRVFQQIKLGGLAQIHHPDKTRPAILERI